MKKFKKTISEVLYISKITAVNSKKVRILFSVVLANVNVLADILIILFFANIIVGEVTSSEFLNNIVEKLYLLPVIIFIRFINNFIQAANIINLQLNVESNLKDHLIREIYKKGGAKEIVMSDAAAKKYIALANGTPVERLKKLNSPEAKELSRLFHGQ